MLIKFSGNDTWAAMMAKYNFVTKDVDENIMVNGKYILDSNDGMVSESSKVNDSTYHL